jgi:acetylglutamate kinase
MTAAHPRAMRVIKLGGRVQEDPRLPSAIATQWAAYTGALCIVHGGGDAISTLQRAAGVEPTFVGGRRITAPEDIDILRMALSGSANKSLVAALVAAGVPAVGLSGEDAGLFRAELLDGGGLGAVGTVTAIDTRLLRSLLAAGYLPVISPLAASVTTSHPTLNVNGDDAAAALARALGAVELLLISDVRGVRIGGRTAPTLDALQAGAALAAGEITGGMVVKVRAALTALDGAGQGLSGSSVQRVCIGGFEILVGADGEEGTTLERGSIAQPAVHPGGLA